MDSLQDRAAAFERLLAIVDRLREPGGCPWDREQTVDSMSAYVIEEGHELVEAVERGQDSAVVEETGDLLMVLAMICRIASEEGRFDLKDAAGSVCAKLVRRHPHVFGDQDAADSGEALSRWESVKAEERRAKRDDSSALAGIPVALPALQRARRTCEKAVAAGFRWTSAAGALAKLDEEVGELHEALAPCDLDDPRASAPDGDARARIEAELGDVLLAGAYLGQYLGIDPERACRAALRRFEQRFRRMEGGVDGTLQGRSLAELMESWRAAKRAAH